MLLAADVGAALESINMDPEAIRAILAMLDAGEADVRSTEVDEVPLGQVGGSDAAAAFANDASLCHQKFRTALEDMVTGLRGYRDNVATYARNQTGTDESARDALSSISSNATILNGIKDAASCVNTPTVATPSQCELPGAEGDS